MAHYRFRLFIAGQAGNSLNAVANIRALGNKLLHGDFDLEIIDVLERPALAEVEKLTATPTLIKDAPLPIRRLIGDLSDTPTVLSGLGLPSEPDQTFS